VQRDWLLTGTHEACDDKHEQSGMEESGGEQRDRAFGKLGKEVREMSSGPWHELRTRFRASCLSLIVRLSLQTSKHARAS
jgi:hypothetical protein